jgi:hypothetical protein
VISEKGILSRRNRVQSDGEAVLGHMKIVKRLNLKLKQEKLLKEQLKIENDINNENKLNKMKDFQNDFIKKKAIMKKMAKESKRRVDRAKYKQVELKENQLQYERDRLRAYVQTKRNIEATLVSDPSITTSYHSGGSNNKNNRSLLQQDVPALTLADGGKGIASRSTFHIPISNPVVKTPRRLAIPSKMGPSDEQLNRASKILGAPTLNHLHSLKRQADSISRRVENEKKTFYLEEEQKNKEKLGRASSSNNILSPPKPYVARRNAGHLFDLSTSSKKSMSNSYSSPTIQHSSSPYKSHHELLQMDEGKYHTEPSGEQAAKAFVVLEKEKERLEIEQSYLNPAKWNQKNLKKKVWNRDPVPVKEKKEWMNRYRIFLICVPFAPCLLNSI